jgi:flavin-dependent dehydrogenase
MRLRRYVAFIPILAVLLTACVSAGVTPIGSNTFTPLPSGSEVLVFSAENQVTGAYKVVGLISYSNPGKYQILSLADVMPDLKEQARKAGANGIIIDESHVIKSGIISTGIGVTARAIILQR